MNKISLAKIIDYSAAELLQGDENIIIEDIVIDSRDIEKNHLFIAIIGEKNDGHSYLKEAVKNGAVAVVVDREINEDFILNSKTAVLKVADTTQALQKIAHFYRNSFKELKLIAVTGSAGKTTTKDLIYSVLSQKFRTLKTEGNYNNHIGLPLTLLKLSGKEDFAVVEMGMSDFGEIKLLAEIARPDWGVITNVAEAHLEQLGSLENIAKAKKELLDSLNKDNKAVLNYDNIYTRQMISKTKAEVISFGFEENSDLQTINYNYDQNREELCFEVVYKEQSYNFKFNKAGKHNIYNIMAALIIAFEQGLTAAQIQKGLLSVEFSDLRMEFITLENGSKIINDSYNANPLAVRAALDVLKELKSKRKIAVLASMLELGEKSSLKHKEIGYYAADKDLDLLITVGKKAKFIADAALEKMNKNKVISFPSNKQAIEYLTKNLLAGDLILIKGSRGNKLEKIVAALKNN